MYITKILSFLYPDNCISCGKLGGLICKECTNLLIPTLPECYHCRTISSKSKTHIQCLKDVKISYMEVFFQYNDVSKKLLRQYKFNRTKRISKTLYQLISPSLPRAFLNIDPETAVIIPIPLHKQRETERGFNQSQLISEMISQDYGIRVLEANRLTNTKTQSKLAAEERYKNTFGVFAFSEKVRKILKGMKVAIIIDDVMTTGSTLNSLATAVSEVSPDVEIIGLALFRGRRPKRKSLLPPPAHLPKP